MSISYVLDTQLYEVDPKTSFTSDETKDLSAFVRRCSLIYDDNWIQGEPSIASVKNDKLFITPDEIDENGLTIYDVAVFDVATKKRIPGPKPVEASPCAPLLCLILAETRSSTVVHIESPNAIMITNTIEDVFFQFSYRDYLKNLHLPDPNLLSKTDVLLIPILDKDQPPQNLFTDMKQVVSSSNAPPAVLLRGGGVFVWGRTWEEVQLKYRTLEVLFNAAARLIKENKPLVFDANAEMKPAIHEHSDPSSLPSLPLLRDLDYYAAQAVNSLSL